jgi:hypothetical protein
MGSSPLWTAVADAQAAVARQQTALYANDPRQCLSAMADLCDALLRVSHAWMPSTRADREAAAAALRPLHAEIRRSLTRMQVRLAWMQDWRRKSAPPVVW